MTIKDYVLEKKPLIQKHLVMFLEEKKKATSDPFLKEAIEKLQNFSIKGKMLRGVFVLLGSEMFGSKISKEILDASATMEMVHAGLLIHDDIMDNDTVRRGNKTIFAQYGNSLYGQSVGICIGDFAFFSALELLQNPAVVKMFSQEIQQVGLAQMKDVVFGHKAYEPTEEEIRTVYRLKTARYSFSLPFCMGAMLAGAGKKEILILDTLGEKLGIAFQIRDDELGLFGEENIIGKPLGSDIRENKKTLLRFLLYKKVPAKEKSVLDILFGNKNLTKKDLQTIRAYAEEYGVINELMKEKTVLVSMAESLVAKLSVQQEYKDMLTQLAQQQAKRIQ